MGPIIHEQYELEKQTNEVLMSELLSGLVGPSLHLSISLALGGLSQSLLGKYAPTGQDFTDIWGLIKSRKMANI